MSRKPKPPPIPEIVVQGLSTGEIIRDRVGVCDLSGELIELAEHYGPHKPPEDLDALKVQRKNTLVEHQRMLLQAVGILPGFVRPKAEPKLAHGQVLTQSGLVFTPKRGPNALKRRI